MNQNKLDVNINVLRIHHKPIQTKRLPCRYREVDESHQLVQWFWQALEALTNDERILFMRFVSGRSRLPANPADISQRFQIMKVDRVSQKRRLTNGQQIRSMGKLMS